jgi:hypothetical protein
MPQIGLPTLKASDVSGIKLGMPAADAIKSATAQFQVARVMSNYATFFNGIDKDRADRVSCIEIENPFIGVAGVEGFDSCLALQMSNGAVTNILSVQHLKGGNPEVIRAALRDKYGEGASSGAGRLSWVGIDAAAAVGAKIEIVSNLTTSSVGDRLVLSIRPYAPAAKPAEQPATPKL